MTNDHADPGPAPDQALESPSVSDPVDGGGLLRAASVTWHFGRRARSEPTNINLAEMGCGPAYGSCHAAPHRTP
jgi:hypothetical protein